MIRGSYPDQLTAVIRALELGINYFDTAAAYGDGQSEIKLGRVLKELRPEITLATKVRLHSEDLSDISGAVQKSVETSLNRLGRDSVDVLQLHNAVSTEDNAASWRRAINIKSVLGKGGVADAFDTMRSQGLTRSIGFTGLGETRALHQLVESERFDVVQVYYNLLNPSAGVSVPSQFTGYDFRGLINAAASRSLGVVIIRVMAGGALGGVAARSGYASPTIGGPMVPSGEYQNDEDRTKKLGFLVTGGTGSLSQAAIRFALKQPGVATVLVGFSNIKQIDEIVTGSNQGPLSESSMERLNNLWSTNFGA